MRKILFRNEALSHVILYLFSLQSFAVMLILKIVSIFFVDVFD